MHVTVKPYVRIFNGRMYNCVAAFLSFPFNSSRNRFSRPGSWLADIDMIWFQNMARLPSKSGHVFCSLPAHPANMLPALTQTESQH
jgi:hypothetical protein